MQGDNNVTIIGSNMSISGGVESTGSVVLNGTIDGFFTGKRLKIAAGGLLRGKVVSESIECAGLLEGNITTSRLQLKATARHKGTVITKDLEVEPGAILDCALHSGEVGGGKDTKNESDPKKEQKLHFIKEYLHCFDEQHRPCCFEVPWSQRMELFRQLVEMLGKRKPLIKVIGEEGSGKTSMVQKIIEDLPNKYKVVRIDLHEGSVTEVLRSLGVALGLDGAGDCTNQQELLSLIRNVIVSSSLSGNSILFLLDDAHLMYQATLEGVVRLLSGACDEEYSGELKEARAQLVLFGTDALHDILAVTINEYFEDETNCQFFLDPMTIKDTADYIRLGVQLASQGDKDKVLSLFPHETIKEIHTLSGGNIAKINDLVCSGLQAAHRTNKSVVTPQSLL